MTIQPDSGYWKSRAELINYEQAAFAALRSGVPNCYRDAVDNTAWGWILHALARRIGATDYLDQYHLIARNPALLTPPDLLRQMVPFLPLGQDYPNNNQFDLDFKTMVLRLLKAYRQGARLPALAAVIEAFTGADPSTFSVTEMYTLIGTPGVDCSYRNTIRIEVPIGGTSSSDSLFTASPNLIQDIYQALAATKAAHVGIELIGVFPRAENVSSLISNIRDSFRIIMAMQDGAPEGPWLTLTPYYDPTSPDTRLAPGQDLDLTYQWFKNGVAIEGATSAALNVTAALVGAGPTETNIYYVVITDPTLGNAYSMQIPMLVSADTVSPLPYALPAQPPVDPSISNLAVSQQPMSFSVTEGQDVILTVSATNAGWLGLLVPTRHPQWVIKSDAWVAHMPDVGTGSVGELSITGAAEGTFTTPTVLGVTVSIVPQDAQIIGGFSQQYTATVTGSEDQTCTWSVPDEAPSGQIDATGNYTSSANTHSFGDAIEAAAEVDPTAIATVSSTVSPGYFVLTEPCAAHTCTAIYHLHQADGIEVRRWNAPENTAALNNGQNGPGLTWPSQPGVDGLWCAAPAPSGATFTDYGILANANYVYLTVWAGDSAPDKFLLYSRSTSAASGDPWTLVTLPSDFTGTSKVWAGVSDFTTVTSGVISDNLVLIGVQPGSGVQNVVSWWTPVPVTSWPALTIAYSGVGVTPVMSFGDVWGATPVIIDTGSGGPGGPYMLGTGLSEMLPAGWSMPLSGTWPAGLDLTQPCGLLTPGSRGYLVPGGGFVLWGWSTVQATPTVWPLEYSGGYGTGFQDPGICSQGYSTVIMNQFRFAVPSDQLNSLLVMQSPADDGLGDAGLWACSLIPGSWWAGVTFDVDPAKVSAVGSMVTATVMMALSGPSNSMVTGWDWSASTVGTSWSFTDNSNGTATLTLLDNEGNDFVNLSCNVTVFCPNNGGQTWVYTASSGQTFDGSWGIYPQNANEGFVNPNLYLDPTTGLLNTEWPYNGSMPCVTLPFNLTGVNPGAGYASVLPDGSVLHYCPPE
jgi:hypothetical protein